VAGMASGPYPNVEISLGETLPFLWEGFLKLVGKDQETADLKAWFTNLQMAGFTQASYIQCIGMHGPIPLQQLFQPTKLQWQVTGLEYDGVNGRRVRKTLPSTPISPEKFLDTPTNAAIFAGPGWGKTTLLHHLLLKNRKSEKFVPVLITLRRPNAIADLTRLVGTLLSLKKLNRGLQMLLLVDGYDEIPTSSRKIVSEKLLSFEASGVGRYYLTCRDFYHILDLNLPSIRIAPFDKEDQEKFVASFASAFGSKIKPSEMLYDLRERGMSDLLHHPLLLAMVCIVKSGSMSLHSKSVLTLIERAVETLSFRWDEGKGVAREQKLPVDGRSRVQYLMRIAFQSKETRIKERLVTDEARKHLDLLRWDDLDEYQFVMETARFYGILIPRDDTYWEFVHKTIHDYLAARYWVEKGKFSVDAVKKWDSRAAYAACLGHDATLAMKSALAQKESLPAFVEMLSNDAPFDHPTIARALIEHYNSNPRAHFYETSEPHRISVHLEQDFIRVSSTKFLHDLALACCANRSKAADTFFAYAIAELRSRGQKLQLTCYSTACRMFAPDFRFSVHRYGAWSNVSLAELTPE
jgi:hypothetical protein